MVSACTRVDDVGIDKVVPVSTNALGQVCTFIGMPALISHGYFRTN
jgi:hypothetical protein